MHNREIALCGALVISFPQLSFVLTLFLSNTMKKLRKSWNFWTSSWNKTDKSLPTFRGDHSIFNHYFSLACFREWNLWLEMIDTLVINFWRFRWISAVSRKVLTFLESALRHFEVSGLKITAGQRTMSGLIVGLTGQTLVWPVIFGCLSLDAFCSITL